MSDPKDDEKLDFLWHIHAYSNDYVRFADQKAGLILAIETGLVAALYSAKLHKACSISRLSYENATVFETALGSFAALAFAGLLVAVICSVKAIMPRLWHDFRPSLMARLRTRLANGMDKGAIFWRQVLKNNDKEDYANYVVGLDRGRMANAVAYHIYSLAGVANAKFDWINLSIAFGSVGAIFAILALFMS
jgi:hypothetical protein